MPVPGENENESDFISRCVPFVLDEGTADDQDQAVAICYSIWKDAKKMAELSFQEIEWQIEEALQELFPSAPVVETANPAAPYIVGIYPEYVIIETYENDSWQYWKATYNVDGKPVLSSRADWEEVESRSEWVTQAKNRMAKFNAAIKFDIDAPCKHKAIKILDEDNRRIGAYASIWGELDCENERMTKGAMEGYVGTDATPLMFWLHGLHKNFGSALIGKWDSTAFKMDDLGLWVEGDIYRNAVGDRAWAQIQAAGSYGLSVGSLWYLVKRQKAVDGTVDIIDWPLLEISIMEGGKQCVPSAHRQIRADLTSLYREMLGAMKLSDEGLTKDGTGKSTELSTELDTGDPVKSEDRTVWIEDGKRYHWINGNLMEVNDE